jgi:hypothetical protein
MSTVMGSRSVAGAGDVNGDGLADVIVGAPDADPNGQNSGRAYVVFGKADTFGVSLTDVAGGVGGFVLNGDAAFDHSGSSVSGAGDVNGDGLADVIVSAPDADPNGTSSGRAYVVFGKADTDPVSLADVAQGAGGFVLDGEIEEDGLYQRVSGAGDVNGDGLNDVIVGAPSALSSAGRTYVVFGKADTDTVALADVAQGLGGFAMDGEAGNDNSGGSVSGAGDMNNDGLADVVVGAGTASPNGVSSSGRAYVVFGKTDAASVSLADVAQGVGGFAMDGEADSDRAGGRVSGAGDVNGDGVPDVVVAARTASPNGYFSGRTYVVFGKTDTDRISLVDVAQGVGGFAMDGEDQGDEAGHSAAGAGDVNGDGVPDIIVGAPGASPDDFSQYGRAYVVFGFACSDAGG